LLATLILLGVAGTWYYLRTARLIERALQPLMRLDVDLGSEVSLGPGPGANAILSPDGTRLVYVSKSKLFTRLLDRPMAVELAGTEGASMPFFSPDGQWVAFFGEGKLKKVPVRGGPAIILCDRCRIALLNGASWGEDGNIIAVLDVTLSLIPAAGGGPTRLTELAPGEIVHRWPQVLPGGKAILFSAYTSLTGLGGASIEVMSLRDRRRKTLLRGTWGRYLTTGHLVYINNGTLLAVPFDLNLLEVRGTSVPVLKDITYSTATGSAQIDFSRNGTVVYRSSRTGDGLVTMQWVDGSGTTQPLLPVPGNYLSPTVSPDGNRLALTSEGDIWVYESQRGRMTRLTFGSGFSNPVWSADSRYIAFKGATGMFWIRVDGTANPQPLTQSKNQQNPWSFRADGRLAFVEVNQEGRADIWTVPVDSDGSGLHAGTPEVFLQTPFDERAPSFSPDGRWLAYSSNEAGPYQVYVRAFPDKGGKWQVSTSGGLQPVWSHTGRELFFRNYNYQAMVAPYTVQGASFRVDKPRLWSDTVLARAFALAPDGKRVVALMSAEDPEGQKPQDHVIFLLNFFDELRRRVPIR
jgi:serine/threonine-protein kinase